jgi:hypothetical protein
MASCSSVIILTDSRGAGLESKISKHLKTVLGLSITVRIYKGTTLERIKRSFDRLRQRYDLCIIIAGVCNLTTREQLNGVNTLAYTHSDHKVEQIKDTVNQLIRQNCIVSTISPAYLEGYARARNPSQTAVPDQKSEQDSLLKDISELNSHIKQTSSESGVQILNLLKVITLTQAAIQAVE